MKSEDRLMIFICRVEIVDQDQDHDHVLDGNFGKCELLQ